MIRTGTVIENPVTGERIVFRKTSRDTGGQAVVIETFVQPDGSVAAAHVHPSQEERFEVLKGSVGFRIARDKLVAGPGQRVTVPAGTPHKFWNAGDSEAHFVCEVRPSSGSAWRSAPRPAGCSATRRPTSPAPACPPRSGSEHEAEADHRRSVPGAARSRRPGHGAAEIRRGLKAVGSGALSGGAPRHSRPSAGAGRRHALPCPRSAARPRARAARQ